MSPGAISVSVVVPAYREAARIGECLADITAYFQERGEGFEIIVADDGSDDGTTEAVLSKGGEDGRIRLLRLGEHRGKGAVVRAGVGASRGERVLLVDTDLAIPLKEYGRFAAVLEEGADVVVASKELGRREGTVEQPWGRRVMGRVFNAVVRAVVLGGILDTQAGFKLYRGDAAREIAGESRVDGFAYDVEMLVLARCKGLRIVELACSCSLTGGTSVRVFSDSLRMLSDVAGLRRRFGRAAAKPGKGDA